MLFRSGIAVPAKTPTTIVEKLESHLMQIVNSPDVQARLIELGMTPIAATRQEMALFLKNESNRWGPIIKAANIKIE